MPAKLITINIRRYLVTQPRSVRQKRLSRYVRERIAHYMKVAEENVKIDTAMNSAMTKVYTKSMMPIKANVNIDNGVAKVSLYSDKKPAETQKAEPKAPEKKAEKAKKETALPEQKKPEAKESKAKPKQ
ncbi:hypothetical protein M1567_00640 [Candidatus Marsarchaeota archaeon]|jgi:hypothetical protein|nr:hypothetical protein [Candidatus Marsarchaeota archaeon]